MKDEIHSPERDPANVSVPLRGSGYERGLAPYYEVFYLEGFPSPCGEVVMKGYAHLHTYVYNRMSFRPLAGKWL